MEKIRCINDIVGIIFYYQNIKKQNNHEAIMDKMLPIMDRDVKIDIQIIMELISYIQERISLFFDN